MNLRRILILLAVTLFVLMANIQESHAVQLNLTLHGEPLASELFIRGASGDWTFEQDTFSVGVELGHEDDQSYFYIGSRLILNANEYESTIAGTGVVLEAGMEAGRMISINYKSIIYWDQSGNFGYGQLCYTKPAHRLTVDVKVPIFGGKIPCLNESDSYSY